jgi:hypothetical protein
MRRDATLTKMMRDARRQGDCERNRARERLMLIERR